MYKSLFTIELQMSISNLKPFKLIMMKNQSYGFTFLLILFFLGCTPTKQIEEVKTSQMVTTSNTIPPKIKNVILLVGDGMGVTQVSSSFYFGATKDPNFVRFPITGFSRTSSASHLITDSAAGAVAFASGVKTYNGAIGKGFDFEDVETIIERVKDQNIYTGLIATSSITHATPATFYAHVNNRGMKESIAEYLVPSSVDFFAGGGLKFFNKRKDKRNLVGELENNGFVMDTVGLAPRGTLTLDKRYGYLLAEDKMPSKLQGRDDYLVEATQLALDYLSKSKDGFFLMVEGSQIDWGGHQTNVDYIVEEVKDFDKAIGAALDFAMRDGETLVIVTADHETGGFALAPPFGKVKEPFKPEVNGWDYRQIAGSFFENADTMKNRAAHTAAMVPVFAYGPGSEIFSGIYQNNEIFHKMVGLAEW